MFSRSKELELSLLELHWIDNRTRDNREKLNGGGGRGETGSERNGNRKWMNRWIKRISERKEGEEEGVMHKDTGKKVGRSKAKLCKDKTVSA